MDLRKRLYSEILLAGGNTMIHGFPERFLNELNKVLPKELKVPFLKIEFFTYNL